MDISGHKIHGFSVGNKKWVETSHLTKKSQQMESNGFGRF
jgi:hypothetical protein